MFRKSAIRWICSWLALAGSAPVVHAAPVKPAARAVPRLVEISVLPASVQLAGPRSEQALVVTGRYADGSLRDLTAGAAYTVSAPQVVKLAQDASRRVLRPSGDGAAAVTVSVPGAGPRTVPVHVRDFTRPQPVSFRDEVVPALTKAGCSAGTCHGTPTGKGGLKLSLQGYAPELDYVVMAREGGSRRINKADPGRSLFLLKPSVEVPHGGGKRLSPQMPEFRAIGRWIGEGARDDAPGRPELAKIEILPGPRVLMMPGAKQQIIAMAHFTDGSVRDVTSLAKLSSSDEDVATVSREGLVEGLKRGDVAIMVRYQDLLSSLRVTFLREVPGFKWNNPTAFNYVDTHVFKKLKLFQIPTAELCSDREFLRRAYLDAIGVLPTAEEARAFLLDTAPDKRAKVIDRLLERPEFADFWALKWADVLRVQDETMKEQGARKFHAWIRDSFAAKKPMDQFVREVITASGPTSATPTANFYRGLRDPQELTEGIAQLFMGVRMLCAKCHNHPFERWTQNEYYSLAAFFAQVRQRNGPTREEETVWLDPKGEVQHLRTGKTMRPKFLGDAYPEIGPGTDRRAALAEWLTRKDNPFFAKALANRVWSQLLGRGIVEPIDDFRDSNPPVNAELLDALAADLAEHKFDLRHLVRSIMSSRTYQLSAKTAPLNKDDGTHFSHAVPRLMTAEVLSDAITSFTGVPEQFPGYPRGTRAVQLAGTRARTPFLKTFGRPDRNLTCECEREKEPTLLQALALIGGRNLDDRLRNDSGRLAEIAQSAKPDAEVVDELYLSAFARFPSTKEKQGWLTHFGNAKSRREAIEDMGWVLVNSKEFLFRY